MAVLKITGKSFFGLPMFAAFSRISTLRGDLLLKNWTDLS